MSATAQHTQAVSLPLQCPHCNSIFLGLGTGGFFKCNDCGKLFDHTPPIKPKAAPATASQVGGSHYKGMAIQPAEYCQRNRLGFLESSVVKYVSRHRARNKAEDIRKAIHCLQLLLEMEYPNPETT